MASTRGTRAEADEEQRVEAIGAALSESMEQHAPIDTFVADVYESLRRIASHQLRSERPDHTLHTTALVHESYLRLRRLERLHWRSRAHFCAEAARAMRRVLVDHAVRRGAWKRGGRVVHVPADDTIAASGVSGEAAAELDHVLALHEALDDLARAHPRHARMVECRFFGGMSVPEIAEALGVSPATVKRDWPLARAWLNRALGGEDPGAR